MKERKGHNHKGKGYLFILIPSAGEMVQLAEHKYQDPSSNPQHPGEKLAFVITEVGKLRQEDPQNLLASLTNQINKLQFSSLPQKLRWKRTMEEDTVSVDL